MGRVFDKFHNIFLTLLNQTRILVQLEGSLSSLRYLKINANNMYEGEEESKKGTRCKK